MNHVLVNMNHVLVNHFYSNNEPFDSGNNTKTWVSMLFDIDSDSDSDSEYDSCDSDSKLHVNNTKTWISMLFDSDSGSDSDSDSDSEYDSYDSDNEYDLCDSDSDSDSDYDSKAHVNNTKTWVSMLFDNDSDSEYNSCDSDSDSDSEYDWCDSDSEYYSCDSDSDSDSCNNDSDSDYDSCHSEYDSNDKTDINDNKEMINQLNNFITLRKSFLNYINKIEVLKSEIQDDIYSDLPLLKYARMNKINELLDESLDYVWNMIYSENREKNEISNMDIDMNNDNDRYVSKYSNIVNDKSDLVNKIKELLDSFMLDIGRETSHDIIEIKMHEWKINIQNLIKVDGGENDDFEVDRSEVDRGEVDRIVRLIRDQLSDNDEVDRGENDDYEVDRGENDDYEVDRAEIDRITRLI